MRELAWGRSGSTARTGRREPVLELAGVLHAHDRGTPPARRSRPDRRRSRIDRRGPRPAVRRPARARGGRVPRRWTAEMISTRVIAARWRRSARRRDHGSANDLALGFAAAAGAAACYEVSYAAQALEARSVDRDQALRASLLARLVRRPRWLAAIGLALFGWVLQIVALGLAPLDAGAAHAGAGPAAPALPLAPRPGRAGGPARRAGRRRDHRRCGGDRPGAPERTDETAGGVGLAITLGVLLLTAAPVRTTVIRVGSGPAGRVGRDGRRTGRLRREAGLRRTLGRERCSWQWPSRSGQGGAPVRPDQ